MNSEWSSTRCRRVPWTASLLLASAAITSCEHGPSPPKSGDAESLAAETRPQRAGLGSAPLLESKVLGDGRVEHDSAALVHPNYLSVREADVILGHDDAVFVIRGKDASYVYPRTLLSPVHIVNETIDGQPVAVTYCQLSESATLFSRVVDDEVLTFAWIESLYNGTLMMGDRSGSRWIQFLGKCLEGTLRGQELTSLGDIDRMRWSVARTLPNLRVLPPVLDLETSRSFVADMDESRLGLHALGRSGRPDRRLEPYDRGLGISVQGESLFIRLQDVRRHGLIEGSVGGWSILVLADEVSHTARIFRRFVRGRVLHFRRQGSRLSDTETGSLWNREGQCIEGELAGEGLERPLYTQSWWFAWSSFYPGTTYWTAIQESD